MSGVFIPLLGDCRELLQQLEDNSVDALATDPPYGIGYQSRKWDTFKPTVVKDFRARTVKNHKAAKNPNLKGRLQWAGGAAVEYDRSLEGQRGFQEWTRSWATEVLRVLKPGAYGVVCGAPRSQHRMFSGLEDAGFEVKDCLMWISKQGFPKSLNLGNGVGTALRPGWEPIALVRKPLGGLTTTKAYRVYGTGGLAIDACRMEGGQWSANILTDINDVDDPIRYFHCPKVSTREREFGCESLPARTPGDMTGGRKTGSAGLKNPRAGAGRVGGSRNAHPT